MKLLRTLVTGLAVTGLAVTVLASPLAAQTTTTQVKLTGSGSTTYNGIYVGPYQARLGSDPGAPSVDVYCVDYMHTVSVGQTWNANVTNLMSGSLNGVTRGGDAALSKYQQMAWLTTQFDGATAAETRAIQTAIWNVMTPSQAPDINKYGWSSSDTEWWLKLASKNYLTSGLDYSTFAVVTDVKFKKGGTQEFLTRVPTTVTPEPGTYLLMATGLTGVAMISRRRRRQSRDRA